jgi:hypothetical protein
MAADFPRDSYDEEGDTIYIELSDAAIARTREAGSVWVNVDEAELLDDRRPPDVTCAR